MSTNSNYRTERIVTDASWQNITDLLGLDGSGITFSPLIDIDIYIGPASTPDDAKAFPLPSGTTVTFSEPSVSPIWIKGPAGIVGAIVE